MHSPPRIAFAHILNPTQPGFGRRGGNGFRLGYRLDSTNAADSVTVNVRRLPSAKSLAPGMRMHPNTPNVRMVDNFGGYTAASGHAFMISDALPPRLHDKALVTEPTAKLIGIMDIQRDGAGYKASMASASSRAQMNGCRRSSPRLDPTARFG